MEARSAHCCGQHAPTPLTNGNLLIFDNGRIGSTIRCRFPGSLVERAPKRIVREYREKRESDFFSPRISNAQRLPNGNTLVCEGDFGRIFEVTTEGLLVWEYVNPYFGDLLSTENNRVFCAYRYIAEATTQHVCWSIIAHTYESPNAIPESIDTANAAAGHPYI